MCRVGDELTSKRSPRDMSATAGTVSALPSLLGILRVRTRPGFITLKSAAEKELESVFPPHDWGIDIELTDYTVENKRSLWDNEMRKPIRRALESGGGSAAYSNWLQDVHFVMISIYRRDVFKTYNRNVGWRVAIIALPAAGVIATGIASHYQGGQNHNQLGRASNLLFDAAKDGLAGYAGGISIPGRKVIPSDWDGDGLISTPITSVAGVDLTILASIGSLHLKDVRTTTTKKILASYITIEPQPTSIDETILANKLDTLATVGAALAATYPFRSTDEFEPVRSLALQDLAAASLRLQLRRRSSTRSVVRIYYGPPGTGKSLTAVREAAKLADPTFGPEESAEAAFTRFNELSGQVAFITFHQSLQYEDVIESIRPILDQPADLADDEEPEEGGAKSISTNASEDRGLRYCLHEGLFLRMIRKAAQEPHKEFVIVIDEINRGDVGRILGPLISALEPDKRVGAEFPIGIELQYPRAAELESRLYLPANIHFIGTMNSADRNIALVDHALRRRFEFVACPPEPDLLGNTTGGNPIDMKRLLEALNARIEHLINSDHCIGHGYFMPCKTNADVIETLVKKVIPLLVEYFYGNPGMMLLILGDVPGEPYAIFLISEPETAFEKVFRVDRDVAARVGYRAHEAAFSYRLDPRFWDHKRAIPGPGDEDYAVKAVKKIYEHKAAQPPET